MITEKEKQEFFNSLQRGDWVTFSHGPGYVFIAQFYELNGSAIEWGLSSNNKKRFAHGKLGYGNLWTEINSHFEVLRKSTPQELRLVGEGKVMFHELEE